MSKGVIPPFVAYYPMPLISSSVTLSISGGLTFSIYHSVIFWLHVSGGYIPSSYAFALMKLCEFPEVLV
jgi:hypothetical protein